MRATRLIGVYHADGGLVGELRYALGRVLGTTHCALCDITHGGLRPRREWSALCAGLDVPIEVMHLNERTPDVLAATEGRTPCVLAEVDGRLSVLLGADDLAACGGDVRAFERDLRAALLRVGT